MADDDVTARAAAIDAYRHRLDHLQVWGRHLRDTLANAPQSAPDLLSLGVWQRECATTVSQLSGGSKAHWLSQSFSNALLVPVAGGESASVVAIIDRLLEVLDSAGRSLSGAELTPVDAPSEPPPSRFANIDDAVLRASLERAYLDGLEAFERGESALALMTFCSILETVITYALEAYGADRLAPLEPPEGPVATWPFVARIATAERAGLISRGCARLPIAAREYRDRPDASGGLIPSDAVSLRDARLASDVLHVILHDLSPGR